SEASDAARLRYIFGFGWRRSVPAVCTAAFYPRAPVRSARMSVLRGRTLAVYAGLCAIWGSTWLAIKIGLRDLPPLRFAGMRMALACLLLTPFALARSGPRSSPAQRRWIAWAGFLQIGVAYACLFVAEQWIDSGLTALLFATFPIFVGVFAHYLLPDEPLTGRRLAAAALGPAGL